MARSAPGDQPAGSGGRPAAAEIACFVFDLDGTLSNTWPVALAAFRAAIEHVAERPFSDAELMALAGPAEEGILQRLFPQNWEACFRRYVDGYARALPQVEILFPGVHDLLTEMRRTGKTLAVNSGKSLAAVDLTLREAGIHDAFTVVHGGSPAGDRKAETLLGIASELQIDRSRIAYVGDSPGDMRAARRASVLPVGAAWSAQADPAALAAAEAGVVFHDVAEFRAWLSLPEG